MHVLTEVTSSFPQGTQNCTPPEDWGCTTKCPEFIGISLVIMLSVYRKC